MNKLQEVWFSFPVILSLILVLFYCFYELLQVHWGLAISPIIFLMVLILLGDKMRGKSDG